MIKLVRGTFSDTGYLKDGDGNGVKYSYIKKLHELQESSGLHLCNKLRRAHIEL